jgi:hypothetical protein
MAVAAAISSDIRPVACVAESRDGEGRNGAAKVGSLGGGATSHRARSGIWLYRAKSAAPRQAVSRLPRDGVRTICYRTRYRVGQLC